MFFTQLKARMIEFIHDFFYPKSRIIPPIIGFSHEVIKTSLVGQITVERFSLNLADENNIV